MTIYFIIYIYIMNENELEAEEVKVEKIELIDDETFEKDIKKYDEVNKFFFSSKSVFLTYPRCDIDEISFFNLIQQYTFSKYKIKLCVVSSEFHKINKYKHIHTYIEFEQKIKTENVFFFDVKYNDKIYHPNIQRPYNKIGILKYICGLTKKKKDDEKHVFEYNINVEDYLKSFKTKKNRIFYELINKRISLVDLMLEKPELIKIYKDIKVNLNIYWNDLNKSIKEFTKKSYWIYGPPGIGKSYSIRKNYPELYYKDCSKWWDGYVYQEIVLIDDFDDKKLGHYLKIWSDNYAFFGEVKGGNVECYFKLLFITSNFLITELFNFSFANAIRRRFIEINAEDYLDDNGYFNIKNIKI